VAARRDKVGNDRLTNRFGKAIRKVAELRIERREFTTSATWTTNMAPPCEKYWRQRGCRA